MTWSDAFVLVSGGVHVVTVGIMLISSLVITAC